MSTIATVTATLPLSPILAGLVKADSLTFQADSRTDLASGQAHGLFRRLSRDNAIMATIHALLASDAGRKLVVKASQGDNKACALLAFAIPGVWKDGSGVVAFYAENPTGEREGDRASRPNPVSLALRALNAETIAKEKSDKVARKAQAKADKEALKQAKREASKVEVATVASIAPEVASDAKPSKVKIAKPRKVKGAKPLHTWADADKPGA